MEAITQLFPKYLLISYLKVVIAQKKQFKKYGFTFQFLYDKIDQNTNLVKFPSAKWLFLVQEL